MNESCELFVKGPKNRKTPFIFIGVFVGCLVLAFVTIGLMGPAGLLFSMLIALGGAYLCVKINSLYKIEYEYSVAAGQIAFSMIRNQTIRKTVAVCDIKEISSFGSTLWQEAFEACREKVVGNEHRLLCIGEGQENVCFIVSRGNDGKTYRIYFAPNERILEILGSQSLEVKRWSMKNGGFGV